MDKIEEIKKRIEKAESLPKEIREQFLFDYLELKTLAKDKENDYGENLTITSAILNKLVNELKLAGAEAISINDERIINTSDIVTANETLILINQQRIIGPYVVKAIGDQTYLQSTLVAKDGYIDTLQKQGYDASIETSNKVEILKYNKEISVKYMQ